LDAVSRLENAFLYLFSVDERPVAAVEILDHTMAIRPMNLRVISRCFVIVEMDIRIAVPSYADGSFAQCELSAYAWAANNEKGCHIPLSLPESGGESFPAARSATRL
jgi:hypothetical protein